ncbi:PP2C family protein-serine/threonine phosphatase [Streptomyces sp. NPDC052036]|uniref:PP2C family protein-serine/threonine phosphatase n=1 Tax=Streptomyces sp. NPDC052036 TaxID=3155171 RepID=UPI003443BE0D
MVQQGGAWRIEAPCDEQDSGPGPGTPYEGSDIPHEDTSGGPAVNPPPKDSERPADRPDAWPVDRPEGRRDGQPQDRPDGQPHDRSEHVRPPEPGSAESRRSSCARAFLRALPALLIGLGVCCGRLTPSVFPAVPLFTAAPLVAAPLQSLRGTVVTGTAALAAVLAVHLGLGVPGSSGAATEAVTTAAAAVPAVLINVLVRRNDARLASARRIAEAAQRAVLPEPPARIGGLRIAARYEAAQADAYIGGDLYAVQDSPHGVRLVVGDVRGKGTGAVAAVAVVIGAFREAAEQEATLEAVAQRLERALSREGIRRDGPDTDEEFTTAVLAEIPHGEEGVVRIVDRGHPAPLLLLPDGTLRELEAREPALPLGMGDLALGPDRAEKWDFPPGSTLLFFTDGVSEARDVRGEFYDPVGRLVGRVLPTPGAVLAAVTEDVARHTGGQATDDMALLAVRRSEHP